MQFNDIMKKCITKTLTSIRLPFRARLTQLQTKSPIQLAQGEGLSEEPLQSVELYNNLVLLQAFLLIHNLLFFLLVEKQFTQLLLLQKMHHIVFK